MLGGLLVCNCWIKGCRKPLMFRDRELLYANARNILQNELALRLYHKPVRDPNLKILNSDDISFFRNLLGSSILDGGNLDKYNEDWLRQLKGNSQLVLFPRKTEEVSKILQYCNTNRIGVVPQGGNTSLVAGSVPVHDEVVVCLSKMNKIESFNEKTGILKCEAGCILEDLDNWTRTRGYIMPLDLAARGSCQIGGNAAANAGGIHFLRYGSLRSNILSMEVVLPNGEILETNKPLYKDNTGFDLKQLFIGSEGSIGIITKLIITTRKNPKSKSLAMLALDSYEKVVDLYSECLETMGDVLSSFEFWDAEAAKMTEQRTGLKPLLERDGNPYEFYILLETSSNTSEGEQERLEKVLEVLFEKDIILDALVAQDLTQYSDFWVRREGISEASSRVGSCYKYDLSTPIESTYSIVADTRKHLASLGLYGTGQNSIIEYVLGFGHVGDGNLHLNLAAKIGHADKIEKAMSPFLFDLIKEKQGSISAEHGLGFNKAPYILYSRNANTVKLMTSIKNLFDPNCIMSPYKFILPESQLHNTNGGGR